MLSSRSGQTLISLLAAAFAAGALCGALARKSLVVFRRIMARRCELNRVERRVGSRADSRDECRVGNRAESAWLQRLKHDVHLSSFAFNVK